jgi:putative transposase
LCELLQLSRSSFYYDAVEEADDGVRTAIVSIAEQFPQYGYRMITKELKRRDLVVNSKRVRLLMHEENLVIAVRRFVKASVYLPNHGEWPNLLKKQPPTKLNEVWAADITFIKLGGAFVYLAVIIDVFSRGLRGWYLGRDLTSELTHRALDRALRLHDKPKIHHSDHGVQYMTEGYIDKLLSQGISVSCSAKGKPTQNGICERFIRTLKDSEVSLNEYADLADARRQIRKFLEDVYMTKRLHSSLGYVTPAEFEAQCRAKKKGK